MRNRFWVLMLGAVFILAVPVSGQEGDVILNPGTVSGSVSIAGYQITSVTVYAIDTAKVYSATVTVNAVAPADTIDYALTVEGDRDYYVIARARVSAPGAPYAVLPVRGPVNVPISGTALLDLSMNPAFVTGTISTGSNSNTIQSYYVTVGFAVPEFPYEEFEISLSSRVSSSPAAPGESGVAYALLVAPGVGPYDVYANIYVDGIRYTFGDNVGTLATGETAYRDFIVDVAAATISGMALLQGVDLTRIRLYGVAYNPLRQNNIWIQDVSTGQYTLDVDAGEWKLKPRFFFTLPGNLSGLPEGYLQPPTPTKVSVSGGENLTGVDLITNPGFIPGSLNLWGANTDFEYAHVLSYCKNHSFESGFASSYVDPETREFLLICSPGGWNWLIRTYLRYEYPDESESSLYSYVEEYSTDTDAIRVVEAGQTASSLNLTYGTITVRRYFYVAGGGLLHSPYVIATRHDSSSSAEARGYGSSSLRTEGQAIVTLLLPGTYTIEAFAQVDGSNTEFGSVDVTVDEGDVVVIGGTDRPTIQITNPTNEEVVCGTKATVEGTISDDYGIASITINGEEVAFDPNENPVHFSHEVVLTLGENLITIVVTDTDQTEPVVLTMTVISEDCGDPYPVVTITSPSDGQTVDSNTIIIEGTAIDDVEIASITINGEDVAFEPAGEPGDPGDTVQFSHEIELDSGENVITIVVSDTDQAEPTVTTLNVTVEVPPAGGPELPDLAITADDIQLLAYDAGDSTITIDAAVHNVGTATASAVTVRFYEFNTLLGEAEVVDIPAGDMRSVPITIPMPAAGERLIQVILDPLDAVEELEETNNQATQVLLVNTGDLIEGHILIAGSVPTSVCSGSSFSVTGTAVYDLYVDGVRYTDYAVKGGMVEMTVIGPDGEQWLYGGDHTDIYGTFSQVLQAPATVGIYRLLITVTDTTFIGECELVFEVKECSSSTPPPGSPYGGRGGGGGGGSGYWVPPGSGGGGSTEWTWVWTERPPGAPASDVYVYSEDIHFSINHPDTEQEITIFAEIHYWAESTDLVAYDVPINIYATYPGEDRIQIGETLIDELAVGWPDFGSQYVLATWKADREGIYIIEVEVDPSYSEENMLNNAATRAIIVGDLGYPWGAIEGQVREALGGVDDVIVDLYDADYTTLIESRITSNGGYYLFADLPAETYQVHIRVPDGYVADAETKPAEVVAQSITTVNFFLSQTAAPVADAGGPYSGEVGLPVTLDASGSYDPDGVIVSYEWDCNGDGEYDEITSSPQISYTWDTAYNGTITLRVTDDDGLTATDTATVTTTGPLSCGVDIYPNRMPNPVYLSTNYTIYVAVLGSEDFDVTTLDFATVRFGRTGMEAGPVRMPTIRDLNGDGFDDALYGFLTFDCGFEDGDTSGILTGQTVEETPVAGSDSVVVLP